MWPTNYFPEPEPEPLRQPRKKTSNMFARLLAGSFNKASSQTSTDRATAAHLSRANSPRAKTSDSPRSTSNTQSPFAYEYTTYGTEGRHNDQYGNVVPNPLEQYLDYSQEHISLPLEVTPPTRPPPFQPETLIEPPTPQGPNTLPFSERSSAREAPRSQKLTKSYKSQQDLLRPKPSLITPNGSPATSPELRGRQRAISGANLLPPPTFSDLGHGSPRSVSQPRTASNGSPSQSQYSSDGGSSDGQSKLSKRRSWLPGGRSRASSFVAPNAPRAWIVSADGGSNPYDTGALMSAGRVSELW